MGIISPSELFSDTGGGTTVLIGANGSGKSRAMRELCMRLAGDRRPVLAIAPSLHDRFAGIRKKTLRAYSARQGQTAVRRVLSRALLKAYASDPQVLKNLTRALRYAQFDPCVGIRISRVDPHGLDSGEIELPPPAAEEIRSALQRWKRIGATAPVVRFQLESHSFEELVVLSLGVLVKHERLLRRHNIISRIEYFFCRGSAEIPVLQACSGEILHVAITAFIAANITRGATILVDEPETSMHPTWQASYVSGLLDLFSYYEPRIVIATHSPIIISGAESARAGLTVFELTPEGAKPFHHTRFSLEEMYDRLFGLITPRNHHLSKRAMTLLDALNARKITLEDTLRQLELLKEKSYDGQQREAIDKIGELARRVEEEVKSDD